MKKRLVLVCEDSLCPKKQPDVSGPGLGEAGRYTKYHSIEAVKDAVKLWAISLRKEFRVVKSSSKE